MDKLIVSNVYKRLGANEVLKGVSFELRRGEVVALLGPSGSGKTTLLRAIAGLDHPDTGRITLGNQTLFDSENGAQVPAERRNLGLVFQSYALWPHRTVFENVAYGLKLRRLGAAQVKRRVEHTLGQIGLAHLAARYPHQLSGGQQQRVALARALIYEPAVILLDEPLSNLDAKLRDEARAWLRALIVSLNLSALLVTHDQIEAMAIADRITLLNGGRIEQQGSPIDLYTEPSTLFAAEFMGNNNRLEGTLVENADKRAVVEVMGVRMEGLARTQAAIGDKATGVIRLEKVMLGGGPGSNRILMTLKTQMYIGERWEMVFVKEGLTVRTYASAPLKHEVYHVEFPAHAMWIF